ncbi:flavin reductase family protein [Spongiactinospora sp. TRM90649]|uniref:flavin reductase family protein n=1 Tax=Spongiactinospora sp. TRM90649 TaxID=3031114 RepID=UPI0023F793BC|nr:flavin reductase family protein [Spongiactinospora sp. TRM90649]MDF5753479.1 flavin reductase family protein [Spongiactinospora sp. TRM90649]
MSAFPTGVAVVTSFDAAGRAHGMTCTALSSVTLDPATLLVCLGEASGTLAAVRESGYFAVNLLHAQSRHVADIFSRDVPDRFAQVEWRPSPKHGQPWLVKDAFALAGCEVRQEISIGDHALVLGEVHEVEQRDDVPLLVGLRRFTAWRVS